MQRKALGKGLDALLPHSGGSQASLAFIDVERISPNQFQPRDHFDPAKLQELAASIREKGVLQPIVVRPSGDDFEIVAGERRWRATQMAGLHQIPAVIQDVSSDREMLERALVENIHRDDLSPIEEANAYQLMIEQFQLTQEEVASKVGRSRTAVTNMLRLLQLPDFIQAMIVSGELSMGHARALLPLPVRDQRELSRKAVAQGWSVREIERQVQRLLKASQQPKRGKTKDPNIRMAEETLEEHWQTRVEIRQRGDAGQIVLHFNSADELDRLYETLVRISAG